MHSVCCPKALEDERPWHLRFYDVNKGVSFRNLKDAKFSTKISNLVGLHWKGKALSNEIKGRHWCLLLAGFHLALWLQLSTLELLIYSLIVFFIRVADRRLFSFFKCIRLHSLKGFNVRSTLRHFYLQQNLVPYASCWCAVLNRGAWFLLLQPFAAPSCLALHVSNNSLV